ncbi:uncharacterized protein LOC113207115 [Frankliniella occidentalis]|uniref:Uncharacterized protein LOC113207115 n=1 Tax=Frankliniella occidentalis TaxID=133901 RepID=A0A9C6XTJ5_FRAOC|nr:uncharacterized protein LOC113207115 [Frankliniella occidentalis]XP_052130408.1 uncharacterized protein LOC113207115 [Frankliniella occidentalis]XP_052130409.1 uncharacterized protein LOC113207115 [Frankliniella occidentalis]
MGTDTPLYSLLEKWRMELDGSAPQLWKQALFQIRRCKWMAPMFVVFVARSTVDLILAHSLAGIQTPLQHVANVYSAMWALFFFADFSAQCSGVLQRLAHVSIKLEHGKDAATKMLVLFVAVIPFYRVQALAYVLFASAAVLYRGLGAVSASTRSTGEIALRHVAAMHSPLLAAASETRKVFEVPLLRLVLCAVVLPLFGTVELAVSLRHATTGKFAVTIFRAIANLFIPICFTGQLLEDASGALRSQLYAAPWPEERPPARRLRAALMLGAGAQARVELRGLGRLNAATCLEVLQRWFSVVNVLINAQGGMD